MKKNWILLFLCVELVVYGSFYFFGHEGWPATRQLRRAISDLERDIAACAERVAAYDQSIGDWRTYPYYQEQYIREQLQYAQPEEELFVVT